MNQLYYGDNLDVVLVWRYDRFARSLSLPWSTPFPNFRL